VRKQCLKYSSAQSAAGLSRVEKCSSSSKIPIPIIRPFSFTIAAEEIVIGSTFATKFSKFRATAGNTFKSPLDIVAGSTPGQTPAGTKPGVAQGLNHVTRSGPNQEHSNSPQSALDAVRVFYTYISKYQPLGLPQGRAKKDLWPLLSKRLTQELDTLQACEDDYYKRYGDFLRANQ